MIDLRNPEVALAALQDPGTTGGDLDEIAQMHPSMQRRVAAHINADEALLRYLTAHGDPVAVRIASRRLKSLEPATPHPSLLGAPDYYPVLATMPGKSVVKRPRPSPLQALAIGALVAAVGATGVVSVRMYENSLAPDPPPPIGGPEVPGPVPPLPGVQCQAPSDAWLFGICGTGDDYLTSVAITGNGTVIAVGNSDSADGSFFGLPEAELGGFMAIVELGGYPWFQRGDSDVRAVEAAPDGTVVGVGTIYYSTALVAKYDDMGEVVWQNQFNPEGLVLARFEGAAVGQDGSIVAWGYADDPDIENSQPNLIMAKYSADGELMWWHDHGNIDTGIGYADDATVDAQGNIFLVGWVEQPGDGPFEAMVSKFNRSGDLVWSKTFGGSAGADRFHAVTTAPNGNVIAVGSGNSPDSVFADANDGFSGILAEIDQNGKLVSFWTYGTDLFVGFNDIAPTLDGGYVIAGSTGSDSLDALVLEVRDLASINSSEFLVWQKVFSGTGGESFDSVAIDSNGEIVLAGSTTSVNGPLPPSGGGNDGVLVRLTPDGQVVPR